MFVQTIQQHKGKEMYFTYFQAVTSVQHQKQHEVDLSCFPVVNITTISRLPNTLRRRHNVNLLLGHRLQHWPDLKG